MFKHKTVRKIAVYTALLSALTIVEPMLSTVYAQNTTQEAPGKPLKRQSAHYNSGEYMPEPITLPQTLNDSHVLIFEHILPL